MRRNDVFMEVERFKKQYSPANIGIWISNLDMEQGTAVKSACCGNVISESSMWRDKMEE